MIIGDTVENFFLKDQDGNDFELYQNLDKKVLLVFYPRDKSLVCTLQLKSYSKNRDKFENLGIRIFGVNVADSKSHQ